MEAVGEELGNGRREDERAGALGRARLGSLAASAARLAPLGLDDIEQAAELGEELGAQAVVLA